MNPPTPPSSAPSPERPAGGAPENFQPPVGMEQAPMPRADEMEPVAPADQGAPAGVTPTLPAVPTAGAQGGQGPSSGAPAGAGVTGPAIAADVDVIEPEWVEKAEQTVRSHYGDPYAEEEAVEDLQIDYLQKRYGYKVGDPNGENNKSEGK